MAALVLLAGCDVGWEAGVEDFDSPPELLRHDKLVLA